MRLHSTEFLKLSKRNFPTEVANGMEWKMEELWAVTLKPGEATEA